MSPNGRLLRAEHVGNGRLRLTFYDPIDANIGLVCGGIRFRSICGSWVNGLNILSKGDNWIEVSSGAVLYTRIRFTDPIVNVWGVGASMVTGYGRNIVYTQDVTVTFAAWYSTPGRIRFYFDDPYFLSFPPHQFEARFGANPYQSLNVKIANGVNWIEYVWPWGGIAPDQWRLIQYPCNTAFVNSFLHVPQSGIVA